MSSFLNKADQFAQWFFFFPRPHLANLRDAFSPLFHLEKEAKTKSAKRIIKGLIPRSSFGPTLRPHKLAKKIPAIPRTRTSTEAYRPPSKGSGLGAPSRISRIRLKGVRLTSWLLRYGETQNLDALTATSKNPFQIFSAPGKVLCTRKNCPKSKEKNSHPTYPSL